MSTIRILIVDDEIDLTRLMALTVEDAGDYEVRTADNGTAGLEAARAFRPHLVFLDLMMPDMDGSEVATEMEEDPELQDTPIVFLTAMIQKAEQRASRGVVGGRAFLAKPASADEIVECIRKYARSESPA